MGRGRQKAKHTKVARDLKYFSPDTNYGALAQELSGAPSDPRLAEDLAAWPEFASGAGPGGAGLSGAIATDDDDDPYIDKYATDDEDESRSA